MVQVLVKHEFETLPTVTHEYLDGELVFALTAAYHWGTSDDNGSEHALDGKK